MGYNRAANGEILRSPGWLRSYDLGTRAGSLTAIKGKAMDRRPRFSSEHEGSRIFESQTCLEATKGILARGLRLSSCLGRNAVFNSPGFSVPLHGTSNYCMKSTW
ncbi:hypothetical protein OF83DRAFT_702721 [Amylostereum chailletii]|nr:hypothetical protein OF83DRAFT_702721 [Amylostereum chailletii]